MPRACIASPECAGPPPFPETPAAPSAGPVPRGAVVRRRPALPAKHLVLPCPPRLRGVSQSTRGDTPRSLCSPGWDHRSICLRTCGAQPGRAGGLGRGAAMHILGQSGPGRYRQGGAAVSMGTCCRWEAQDADTVKGTGVGAGPRHLSTGPASISTPPRRRDQNQHFLKNMQDFKIR